VIGGISGVIEHSDNGTFTRISSNSQNDEICHLKCLPFKNGYVASASADDNSDDISGTVNIWDTKTWTSIQTYSSHTDLVYSVDQIDNDTMVSGSRDQTIQIWRISTGETLNIINENAGVYVVRVFSIENKQIVCGLESSTSNLQIYNYSMGDLIRTLNGHSSNVNSIEMLSGQFMASGGDDQKLIIWDISSYTIKYTLTGHTSSVICIKRLSSNLIASGDGNGTIIIWNWITGGHIYNLTGHTDKLYFNSLDLYDEQTLISGSWDRTVKFWNITNGELIRSINVGIQILSLAMLKSSVLLINKILLLFLEIFK
jgi:WD40 repeat protein